MPKKQKVKETENVPPATEAKATEPAKAVNGAKPRVARAAGSKKAAPAAKRATPRAKKVGAALAASKAALQPSDEEIRIRAYFIAEHRQRLGLPGDSDGDWIEARRQLLSEVAPR